MSTGTSRKMLVLDSERTSQRIFLSYGEMLGWDVVASDDGEAGIKIAWNQKFDALVMNSPLHKVGVIDVITLIREPNCRNFQTPIMISGYQLEGHFIASARSAGANSFLQKPLLFCEFDIAMKRLTQLGTSAADETPRQYG